VFSGAAPARPIDATAFNVASPYLDQFFNFHYPSAGAGATIGVIDKNGVTVFYALVDGTKAVHTASQILDDGSGNFTELGKLTSLNGLASVGSFGALEEIGHASGTSIAATAMTNLISFTTPNDGIKHTYLVRVSGSQSASGSGQAQAVFTLAATATTVTGALLAGNGFEQALLGPLTIDADPNTTFSIQAKTSNATFAVTCYADVTVLA